MTLTLSLLAALLAANAQSVAKTPRIRILTPTFDAPPFFQAFRQGLCDLGYVEGQSITLEYRFAGGFERLRELAGDLVRLQVDVILADGGQAAAAAQHTTRTIAPVPGGRGDPVGVCMASARGVQPNEGMLAPR